jgi:hypothetical protein
MSFLDMPVRSAAAEIRSIRTSGRRTCVWAMVLPIREN